MTRARRQSQPPGGDVPGERRHERAQDSQERDHIGVDEALADGGGNRAAHERARQVENGGHPDGLARRQDLGRDHRGDGVGRIMEAVAVLEDDSRQNNGDKNKHGRSKRRLRVF